VSALQDLLTAQNTFQGVWVFYEAQRRNLDQDLGTIRVDADNIWVDPGPMTSEAYGFGGANSDGLQQSGMGNGQMMWSEPTETFEAVPPVMFDANSLPSPANPGVPAREAIPLQFK
jgi:hypothetical protein